MGGGSQMNVSLESFLWKTIKEGDLMIVKDIMEGKGDMFLSSVHEHLAHFNSAPLLNEAADANEAD
jgi:hypothetical protein